MAEIDLGIEGLSEFKEIGSGGFATVYSALEAGQGRQVAVKVLDALDDSGRRRFDRERLTMGQTTDHQNIVTLFRAGYTEPGSKPFMVMEYLSGGSLQDALDGRLEADGPFPWPEAVRLIRPIGDALGFSHQVGIVHKDVKPANILVSATGIVKLTDFGIAAIKEATATSQVAYSLAYAPPEAFTTYRDPDTGELVDPRDERSDLYSLAVALYALGAGQPPFAGPSQASLIHQIITEAPPSVGHEAMDRFFNVALAKDPDHRYQTAARFTEALDHALPPDSTPITGNRDTTVRSDPPDPDPTIATDRGHGGAPPVGAKSPGVGEHLPKTDQPDRPPPEPTRSRRRSPTPWPRQRSRGILIVALVAAAISAAFGLVYLNARDTDPTSETATEQPPPTAADPLDEPRSSTVDTSIGADPERTVTTYTGHTNAVRAVVELSSGEIASAGLDGTVRVWDPADPDDTIATYTGHTTAVLAVVELTNGQIASASSADGTVHIWDPDDPETTRTAYTGHTSDVLAVEELSDGRIASASLDATVQIWDPGDPEATIGTYTGHTAGVEAVVELSTGQIASAGLDGTVQVWDPTDPDDTIATYTGHTNAVRAVVELSNGEVASAGWDGTVRVWDPADPDDTIATYTGHTSAVLAVVELTNGQIASASGADGTVQIWDPRDPETTLATYTGHTSDVLAVEELSDGRIASGGLDGTVQVWDPATPEG